MNSFSQQEVTLERPFFSVIMPCLNSEKYLQESLKSVLDQNEKNFELIVVDDGSTDLSKEIIQRFVKEDYRVKLIENHGSSGASGARNSGAYHSKGQWICFLDSDDLFLSDCLSTRKSIIKDNPDIKFFSSDFFRWNENSSEKIRQSEENGHWKSCFSGVEDNSLIKVESPLKLFLEGVVAWTGGVTLHRELFMNLGGFNETLHRAEDHHLWFRCAAYSRQIGLIKKADSVYRIRNSGLSGGIDRLTSYNLAMYRLMKEDPLFSNVKKNIDQKSDHYRYLLSLEARAHGDWFRAIYYAFFYWAKMPLKVKRLKAFAGALLLRQ